MRRILFTSLLIVFACLAIGQQNVGIGTTTPQQLLHLHGGNDENVNLMLTNSQSGLNISNSMLISYRNASDANNNYGQIYVPGNTRFWIRQGSNYPLNIASNGAVGIGSTNPMARLHVSGGSAIIENTLNNTSYLYLRSGTENGLYLETSSDGTNTLSRIRPISGGGANRGMVIRSNSYVGLGTLDAPQYPLHVHATSDALSTSGIAFTHSLYGENVNNGMRIGMRVGNNENEQYSFIATRPNENFYFFQGINNRMRIASNGNIAIGNHIPHTSAALDISATNRGVLLPRLTQAQRNAIASPANGLLIYQTDQTAGFHYRAGTNWIHLGPSQLELITQNNKSGWRLRVLSPENYGNIGTAAVDFSQSEGGPSTTMGATGNFSFATGRSTTASGMQSMVFGNESIAGGRVAFAAGNNTAALCDYSTAFGQFTTANLFGSFVLGSYNQLIGSLSGIWNWIDNDPLFVIGNGTNEFNRSNAMTVLKNGRLGILNANEPSISIAIADNGNGINRPAANTLTLHTNDTERMRITSAGNVGFGINNPMSAVHANSRIIIERPTGGSATTATLEWRSDGAYRGGMGWDVNAARFFFYDGKSNSNTMLINNGRIGIQRDPTTNALEVNGNASKNSAGDWLANSDARLKSHIQPLDGALTKITQLQGVTYEWADNQTGMDRPAGVHMGFTAQNIQEVFPQLVVPDAQGYLQTAYGTYDALYVEAIKELLKKIEVLEARLKTLEQK